MMIISLQFMEIILAHMCGHHAPALFCSISFRAFDEWTTENENWTRISSKSHKLWQSWNLLLVGTEKNAVSISNLFGGHFISAELICKICHWIVMMNGFILKRISTHVFTIFIYRNKAFQIIYYYWVLLMRWATFYSLRLTMWTICEHFQHKSALT